MPIKAQRAPLVSSKSSFAATNTWNDFSNPTVKEGTLPIEIDILYYESDCISD
jgi:hypothetical protein